MELEPCLVNDGIFLPDETCGGVSPPCDGACCLWIQNVGIGCIENFGPFECRQLPGSPGAEDVTYTMWRGPGSSCPAEDCDPAQEECCPGEGACCRKVGNDVWGCTIETPDDCVDDGSDEPPVFKGIGTTCATPGICGGACCHFQDYGGSGGIGCFDVDDNYPDCFGPHRTFLGPGTTCLNNAGDCGICCVIDPATCAMSCRDDLSQQECVNAGGTPFGPGADCSICDFVKRACCIPRFTNIPGTPGDILEPDDDDDFCGGIQYKCKDVSNCIECINAGGFFHPDQDCSSNPCLLEGGACCCPEGACPNPPCPDDQGDQDCVCYHTLEEDCPNTCIWRGPGRGCRSGGGGPGGIDPNNVPPTPGVPEFCLVDCDQLGCVPGPMS